MKVRSKWSEYLAERVLACSQVVALLAFIGCRGVSVPDDDVSVVFRDFYKSAIEDGEVVESVEVARPVFSIATDEMPLKQFLRWCSDVAGVSVVAGKDLDKNSVTIAVVDEDIDRILAGVARRMGVEVTRVGSMYVLGELRPEDKGVLVRKVRRVGGDDLNSAIQVLLSDVGRVRAFDDGLVVVGDKVEVLGRINELLDGIERAPLDTWVIQVFLMGIRRGLDVERGVDIVPAARVAYALASGGGGSVVNASLAGLLSLARSSESLDLVAEPMFLVVDGGRGVFEVGERVPIPVKASTPCSRIQGRFDKVSTLLTMVG